MFYLEEEGVEEERLELGLFVFWQYEDLLISYAYSFLDLRVLLKFKKLEVIENDFLCMTQEGWVKIWIAFKRKILHFSCPMMSILIYKGHTLEGNTLAANYKLSWLKMERKVDKNTLWLDLGRNFIFVPSSWSEYNHERAQHLKRSSKQNTRRLIPSHCKMRRSVLNLWAGWALSLWQISEICLENLSQLPDPYKSCHMA